MQEQQKKEFAHMMNALTKSVEVEIEDEASSAASEHELDADYEAEEEWAKNELKKSEGNKKGEEGKDEVIEIEKEEREEDKDKPYDPESPAFDPKDNPIPSGSKSQPPTPKVGKDIVDKDSKVDKDIVDKDPKVDKDTVDKDENRKVAEAAKKEDIRKKPVNLRFKARKFRYVRDKIDAARRLLGEEKFNALTEPKPYNQFQYKVCYHYNYTECHHGEVEAHRSKERNGTVQLKHHGCQDCLDIRRALYAHPAGNRFCPFKGIHHE